MKLKLNGMQMKVIAVLAMLTDHIGAVFLSDYVSPFWMGSYRVSFMAAGIVGKFTVGAYYCCRAVGRLAFPLFCFLLVEGFVHTKNRTKYLLRMLVFAFISEVPFDLAFYQQPFYYDKQNVFFTLFAGLLALCFIEWLTDREKVKQVIATLISVSVIILLLFVVNEVNTDYSVKGVLLIICLYLFKKHGVMQAVSGALLLNDKKALLAFIPIYLYNGERGNCGRLMKYGFYIFYPLHLLILGLLKMIIY